MERIDFRDIHSLRLINGGKSFLAGFVLFTQAGKRWELCYHQLMMKENQEPELALVNQLMHYNKVQPPGQHIQAAGGWVARPAAALATLLLSFAAAAGFYYHQHNWKLAVGAFFGVLALLLLMASMLIWDFNNLKSRLQGKADP